MEEEQMDTNRILPLQYFSPLLKQHSLKELLFVTETKVTDDDMNPHSGAFSFPSSCNKKLDLFLLPHFKQAKVTIVDLTKEERSSLCHGGDLLKISRGDYYLTSGWTELIRDYMEEEDDFLGQPRKTRKEDDEEKRELKIHVWLSYSKTEQLFLLVKFEGFEPPTTTTTTTTTTTERAKKRRRVVDDDQAAPLAMIEGAKLMLLGTKTLTKSDVCDNQNRLVLPFPEQIRFTLDPQALLKVNEKNGLKVRVVSKGKTWWNILRYADRFSLSKMDFTKMKKELQLKERMSASVYTFSVENEDSNIGFKIDFDPAAIVVKEEDPPLELELELEEEEEEEEEPALDG